MNADPSDRADTGHPSRDRNFCCCGALSVAREGGDMETGQEAELEDTKEGKVKGTRVRTGRRSESNTLKTQVR